VADRLDGIGHSARLGNEVAQEPSDPAAG
jgi:hypothetical protein